MRALSAFGSQARGMGGRSMKRKLDSHRRAVDSKIPAQAIHSGNRPAAAGKPMACRFILEAIARQADGGLWAKGRLDVCRPRVLRVVAVVARLG